MTGFSYLKQCPICQREFITTNQGRRTCSSSCARVLQAAPWWFYDDEYEEGRLHLVRQILAYPGKHTKSQVKWATGAMATYLNTGKVPPPSSRYTQRNSKARQVMEEMLGAEGMADVIARATEETVTP